MAALTDQDDINLALINIGKIKHEGLDNQGLIEAVIKVLKFGKHKDQALMYLSSDKNVEQIKFAKLVWNKAIPDVRKCFLVSDNNWFMEMATDPEMTPLLSDTLDRHTSGMGGTGDASAYVKIAEKVASLKLKQIDAKDAFNPQMTAAELKTITKFDSLAQAREEDGPRQKHNPNESAVTYCFLLGRMIIMAELDLNKRPEFLLSVVDDMLKFFAIHGQKTNLAFNEVLSSFTEICGPKSKNDIKEYLTNLVSHDDYVTASSYSSNNKLLSNHKLSLKRVIRLVYICSKYKTAWGIMNTQDEFKSQILELHSLETAVDSPDMNSLAMIWYLCIGRENINAVMVDHWEMSASNQLAALLGNDERDVLTAPDHVFPLNKPIKDSFKLSE
jgi:hypothetical protein